MTNINQLEVGQQYHFKRLDGADIVVEIERIRGKGVYVRNPDTGKRWRVKKVSQIGAPTGTASGPASGGRGNTAKRPKRASQGGTAKPSGKRRANASTGGPEGRRTDTVGKGTANHAPNSPPDSQGRLRGLKRRSTGGGLAPHFVVTARAGTGKTTTFVQGLRGMYGDDPCLLPPNKEGKRVRIEPSEPQQQIWDLIMQSKGAKSVTAVSFNRSIANELKQRMPQQVWSKTVNGLGHGAVMRNWKLLPGNDAVTGWKVPTIIEELTGKAIKKLRKENPLLVSGTSKLVGMCKANLMDPTESNLDQLCGMYNLFLEEELDNVYSLVPQVLEVCKDPSKHGFIDYNDQIWLPIVHDLPLYKSDLLLADEFQDLTPAQQELVFRSAKRLGVCGDDRQCIYGFAGAHVTGMRTMYERLQGTPRSCREVLLSESRRCSHAVTKDAMEIVPDFNTAVSREGASRDGFTTKQEDPSCYRTLVQPGDMVICRNNAPLVSEVFKFLSEGRKANIQGRNIGASLINLIEKFHARTVVELAQFTENWYHNEMDRERAKKFPSENRLQSIGDQRACIDLLSEGMDSVEDVIQRIKDIFTDHEPKEGEEKIYDGVLLSSAHKSKGLEAKNVWLLEPDGATLGPKRKQSPQEQEQEWNLRYVAITRAMETVNYVK